METQPDAPSPSAGKSPEESKDASRRARCAEGHHHHHGHRRGGRFVFALLIGLVAGTAGGFIGKSFAGSDVRHVAALMGSSKPADPARMNQHIERMVRHFAVETDASPAQQEKLVVIVKGAVNDLAPMREQMRTQRTEAIALLKAEKVDRAGVERLRNSQMQLADNASKRVSVALADVADVLTPEQRQKIAGRLEQFMQRGGRHGWGWRGAGDVQPAGAPGAKVSGTT